MDTQTILIIIGSILVTMLVGFAWILHKLSTIETRLIIVETMLSMTSYPIKVNKN